MLRLYKLSAVLLASVAGIAPHSVEVLPLFIEFSLPFDVFLPLSAVPSQPAAGIPPL